MMHTGHAAHLILDPVSGKWRAEYQGKVLATSPNKKYIMDTIEKGLNKTANACGVTHCEELHSGNIGLLLQANGFEVPSKPEFSIMERFEFLDNLAHMVIDGTANAVLVTGDGGLGKSFTVMKAFKDRGLTFTHQFEPPPEVKKEKGEDSEDSEGEGEDDEPIAWVNPGQVHIVKGFSSAKGLYRTMVENNGKIILFDDCDSIQKDANAVNILKGGLDSSDERWISWNAEEGKGASRLPRQIKFTGRIIFISNWPQHKIDTNLKTRCMRVDLSMTGEERIERMRYIIGTDEFMPNVEFEVKERAVDFLEDNMNMATNLSLRSLLDTIKFIRNGKPNWERQALYSLTA